MNEPMKSVAGIRGIVGDSLVPEAFIRYLLAFGTLINGGAVALGGDSRVSREMMRHLAFAGLASCGCDVFDLGLCPTPTVGLMVKKLGARGGIAITASHNPAEWNAYKFFGAEGTFLTAGENRTLMEIADSGKFLRANYKNLGKVHPRADGIERHVEQVLANVAIPKSLATRKFRVVADCCNGVGGLILRPLLAKLGCEAILFNTDVNAEFPRNPEPLPENLGELSRRVVAEKADIGLAVDPDADRLALVDETGRAIGEERTVTLAALSLLGQGAKGPVVVNLSTTRAIDDVAQRFGATVLRTPIGEAHVVSRMRETGAAIGGEGNGGVIYPAVHSGRDAAAGTALILSAMAEKSVTLSELNAEVPDYVMIKTKFSIAGVSPAMLIEKMRAVFQGRAQINAEDGVKASLEESWVHLRASGTEPVVRVFAEARTQIAAQALVDEVKEKVVGC